MSAQSSHQLAEATQQIRGLKSHDCELIVIQQPEYCKVAVGKEKDRKPVDPPPVLQLKISRSSDPALNYLQSPYFFVSCSLYGRCESGTTSVTLGGALAGTVVSSLHRLKDSQNSDGAFFIFGDLSVKLQGTYRLQFDLYEMRDPTCQHIQQVLSQPFSVQSAKNFIGLPASTPLTRTFSDQGVRLRLRKEPRRMLKKRGPATDDYEPRHYNRVSKQMKDTFSSPESQVTSLQGGIQSYPGSSIDSSRDQPRQGQPRTYSMSSNTPLSGHNFFNESLAKQPRTYSERRTSQTFDNLDQPIYGSRAATLGLQSTAKSEQLFNFVQTQKRIPEGLSYSETSNTHLMNIYPFDDNTHTTPQTVFNSQPQPVRSMYSPPNFCQLEQMITPPTPQRPQSAFGATGPVPRRSMSQSMGVPEMHTPNTYERMRSNSTYPQPSVGMGDTSGFYQPYPNQNPTNSAGTVEENMLHSPSTNIPPGPQEGDGNIW